MKNSNLKKFLSAAAVLAFSATAALAAIPFAACSENGGGSSQGENNDKLISVDKNHSADIISTAQGDIRTQSSGRVYYVAPDGSIANDGLSWDSPYSIVEILKGGDITLQPGDTVYVKPGTYTIVNMVTAPADISGAYNKYIRIVNAALEKDRSDILAVKRSQRLISAVRISEARNAAFSFTEIISIGTALTFAVREITDFTSAEDTIPLNIANFIITATQVCSSAERKAL